MKHKLRVLQRPRPALLWIVLLAGPDLAQATALSYQGRLNDGANPASGFCDLRSAIYESITAGTRPGNLPANSAVTAVLTGDGRPDLISANLNAHRLIIHGIFTGNVDALLSSNLAMHAGGNAFSGNPSILGESPLELGAGIAGQDPPAGEIGYGIYARGALDIAGAGTNHTSQPNGDAK